MFILDNKWNSKKFVSFKEMKDIIEQKFGKLQKVQDEPHDTTKAFQVRDAVGRIGFITSMSEHFCGGCNRLRLSATGHIKVSKFIIFLPIESF